MCTSRWLFANDAAAPPDDLDPALPHEFVALAVVITLVHRGVVVFLTIALDVQPFLISRLVLADEQEIQYIISKLELRSDDQITLLPGRLRFADGRRYRHERTPVDAKERRHHQFLDWGVAVAQRFQFQKLANLVNRAIMR